MKTIRTFSTITCAGFALFMVLRGLEGRIVVFGILSVAMTFSLASLYFSYKSQRARLAAHLNLVGALFAVGASHVRDGQIESVSLWLISLIPLSAGLLLGSRAVIGYSVLAGLFIAAAWLGPKFGYAFEEQFEPIALDWIVMRLLALMVVSLVGVYFVNRTESKVFEIARRQCDVDRSHQQAQAFDAEKTRFLSRMSHEIRTPMNGIRGMTQHWSRQSIDGELRESVDVMNRCAQHLMSLMSDIQDLSKIESGSVEIFEQPFLVNDAVHDVARLFEAKAKSKGVALEVRGPMDEIWALGDRQRIVQVLSNLVGNAVKFSDHGTVTLSWDLDKTAQAYFAVKDQGIGMSPAQVENLFHEFAQVDLDQGVARGGTGLGLTISKAISEAMGGRLEVTSELGNGSEFRLELRLAQVQPSQTNQVLSEQAAAAQTQLSVLVVDDDRASLLVQRLALESMGCEVITAKDGDEAIQAALASSFDLILMDLRMPGKDGIETCHAIRSQSPKNRGTPMIAITASAYVEDHRRCLDAGMQEVIVKPFDFEVLRRSVQARHEFIELEQRAV